MCAYKLALLNNSCKRLIGNTMKFIDNPSATSRPDHYQSVEVDVGKVLKSWQISLYSFEWMHPDGRIKTLEELPEKEHAKRRDAEEKIEKQTDLEKPILGIGLMDNVEIGSGRALFLSLAAHGVKTIPVHIPKSNQDEFKNYLA